VAVLASSNSATVFGDPTRSSDDVANKVGAAEGAAEGIFVFGEKLHDRAENFDVKQAALVAAAAEESPKESPGGEAPKKTLSESAAEYCESHSQKRKFEEVKLVTGEENEVNVMQIGAKLHVFEKSNSTWMERGRGLLRLNDVRAVGGCDSSSEEKSPAGSRIVMRTTGSLRVILNTPLYSGMLLERPTDKTIRLTGTDEAQVKIFLISATPKDIAELFQSIKNCLSSLEQSQSSSSNHNQSVTSAHQQQQNPGDEEEPPMKKNAI
jgi:Ran-binding protein 3